MRVLYGCLAPLRSDNLISTMINAILSRVCAPSSYVCRFAAPGALAVVGSATCGRHTRCDRRILTTNCGRICTVGGGVGDLGTVRRLLRFLHMNIYCRCGFSSSLSCLVHADLLLNYPHTVHMFIYKAHTLVPSCERAYDCIFAPANRVRAPSTIRLLVNYLLRSSRCVARAFGR